MADYVASIEAKAVLLASANISQGVCRFRRIKTDAKGFYLR